MKNISERVFVESQYPGISLGVISQPRGLILIDAPPSPEDGRSWRAVLMNLDGGPDRLLINLDSHPDRTLGVRAMDCTIVAQEKTAHAFRSRSSTFKAQNDESGSEWENIASLGGIRWALPEITFTHNMTLNWGDTPILLESHPGPNDGAIWVIIPEEKIVFVGDAVLKNQPPYLANANLPTWIEELNLLQGKLYKDYIVISGRSGVVPPSALKNQVNFLKDAHKKLERLSKRKQTPGLTDNLVQSLMANFKSPAAHQKQYSQRLRYGLQHYYARNYQHGNNASGK